MGRQGNMRGGGLFASRRKNLFPFRNCGQCVLLKILCKKPGSSVASYFSGKNRGLPGRGRYLNLSWFCRLDLLTLLKVTFSVCRPTPILSQAVIDANIFPVLIEILQKAEFRTRKEAAWAITNATSGGTPEQIRYPFVFHCLEWYVYSPPWFMVCSNH